MKIHNHKFVHNNSPTVTFFQAMIFSGKFLHSIYVYLELYMYVIFLSALMFCLKIGASTCICKLYQIIMNVSGLDGLFGVDLYEATVLKVRHRLWGVQHSSPYMYVYIRVHVHVWFWHPFCFQATSGTVCCPLEVTYSPHDINLKGSLVYVYIECQNHKF